MKKYILWILLFYAVALQGQNGYLLKENIPYVDGNEQDSYRKERCKLDIYYPTDKKDFATIVWFHGGGLEAGSKDIPAELKEKGIAVVTVNYRLSPRAQSPAYVDDAAQAVAWAMDNIASYGGDPSRIYVSGHSAGGYLALMVGMDKSYLLKYGKDANDICGLVPISGQTNTHYTIRKERGLPRPDILPYIDEMAPICRARSDAPPTILITGDHRYEMNSRYEENAHLNAVLQGLGCKNVELYEMQGFDHGTVCAPGCLFMIDWIKKQEKNK